MTISRSDTWLITATLDGVSLGTWASMKGGDVSAETSVIHPGGMAASEGVGGMANPSEVTIERYLTLESDWATLQTIMRASAGTSIITASKQPLDANKAPYGTGLSYTGILKQVVPGDTDSEKSDPLLWSLVFTPYGPIG